VRIHLPSQRGQTFNFLLYDQDTEDRENLHRQDFIGSQKANIGQLCNAPNGEKQLYLVKDGRLVCNRRKEPTMLLVRVVPVFENLGQLELTISGHCLAPTHSLCPTRSYVEFWKPWKDKWLPVARTEMIKTVFGDVNPKFRTMRIPLASLCNGNLSLPIKIRCMGDKVKRDPVLIGEAEVSVGGILSGDNEVIKLENTQPDKCLRGAPGTIRLSDAKILNDRMA